MSRVEICVSICEIHLLDEYLMLGKNSTRPRGLNIRRFDSRDNPFPVADTWKEHARISQ
jgi:hypothetical protein